MTLILAALTPSGSCQTVVDRARVTLDDPDKVTHTDLDLMGYLNDFFMVCRRRRPDMFMGSWGVWPEFDLTDAFPLDQMYTPTAVAYLIFRAESKDDEMVSSGRAMAFYQLFDTGLKQP